MSDSKNDVSLENPTRRGLLMGAAAVGVAMAGNALAAMHEHHHGPAADPAVIDAALDCVTKGNACLVHCIELVKNGDTSIARCLETVSDMLPMCDTLAKLATSGSPHLDDLARVCIAVCEDCEKECRKHEKKHAECRACAESCAACIEACRKLVA